MDTPAKGLLGGIDDGAAVVPGALVAGAGPGSGGAGALTEVVEEVGWEEADGLVTGDAVQAVETPSTTMASIGRTITLDTVSHTAVWYVLARPPCSAGHRTPASVLGATRSTAQASSGYSRRPHSLVPHAAHAFFNGFLGMGEGR